MFSGKCLSHSHISTPHVPNFHFMHPLVAFANAIDNRVIQHAQSIFLKITNKKYSKYLSYFPVIYYALCYYGKRQQTFGESMAMIKLQNSKLRLAFSLILHYIISPKYPEYKSFIKQLDDLIYYLLAVPGWFAFFNIRYSKTRNTLPFDHSMVFRTIGIVSLLYYAIQNGKRLYSLSPAVNNVSNKTCTLCLSPIENISCFPCGHTCCWHCAISWIQKKPQCHICREKCELQDLIMLNGN